MDDAPCIHHIEVGVTNGLEAVASLQHQYRFRLMAMRSNSLADQWVLSKNDTSFLVTSMKEDNLEMVQEDEYIIDWMNAISSKNVPRKDSVFNVCLQVCDLNSWVERLRKENVTFFKGLRVISDDFGSVKVCTIKSCVGDVFHTLVEKKNYTGAFLPGFKNVQQSGVTLTVNGFANNDAEFQNRTSVAGVPSSDNKFYDRVMLDKNLKDMNLDSNFLTNKVIGQSILNDYSEGDWTTFDHVLLAVEMGKTPEIIKWYERLFGMKRFLINSDDSPEDGLVLSSNTVGLRLRAMEYWKCAEVGLGTISAKEGKSKLFFVIAEGLPPLPGVTEENQIESWMKQHHGPGIQHIAFNSPDIKHTVKLLKAHGVHFAKPPPPEYYTEIGRLDDIVNAGEDANLLQEHGILIDTEADGLYEEDHLLKHKKQDSIQERYLLQIFTQPVFKSDPFFMEIIQREGATGFGSGNVAALYRSVQAYIVGKERGS